MVWSVSYPRGPCISHWPGRRWNCLHTGNDIVVIGSYKCLLLTGDLITGNLITYL